jgi:purine-nucleoside phosphorylase
MKSASPELAASKIKRLSRLRPRLGIVLGSGFNSCLDSMQIETTIPYSKLPAFPKVGVAGHDGQLVLGTLGDQHVAVLRGRTHFYEGRSMSDVTFAVRTLAAFGIQAVLLTNAAGAINPKFRVGDFMLLADHINFMGVNPLREISPRNSAGFVDLTRVYDAALNGLLLRAGRTCGIRLRKGVYIAVSGPSYETPAEIAAFGQWGADAVGMSTVPEAIAARQCGLRVCGLSCITNLAARAANAPLNHAEVLAAGVNVRGCTGELLQRFATLFGAASSQSIAV